MTYSISRVEPYPAVRLSLSDEIDTSLVQQGLLESIDFFDGIQGVACLIVDLCTDLAVDVEHLAQHLNAFERTSPTFKQDAPFFVAIISQAPLLPQVMHALEERRSRIPAFETLEGVIDYLKEKIETTFVRPMHAPTDTTELSTVHTTGGTWDDAPHDEINSDDSFFPEGGILRFTLLSSGESVAILPKTETIIGRRSEDQHKPTVDLSIWGAYQHGISRQHAKIVSDSGQLKLIDLGSSNGSYINGLRVRPYIGTVLRHGDELALGDLTMQLTYEPPTGQAKTGA